MSDVVLDLAKIPAVHSEVTGPQDLVILGGDQRKIDKQTLFRSPDGSFDHGIHVEVLRDFRDGLLLPLELHYRRPGRHTDPAEASQADTQRIGHPIGDELQLRIPRQVLEWENGDRGYLGRIESPFSNDEDQHGQQQ